MSSQRAVEAAAETIVATPLAVKGPLELRGAARIRAVVDALTAAIEDTA